MPGNAKPFCWAVLEPPQPGSLLCRELVSRPSLSHPQSTTPRVQWRGRDLVSAWASSQPAMGPTNLQSRAQSTLPWAIHLMIFILAALHSAKYFSFAVIMSKIYSLNFKSSHCEAPRQRLGQICVSVISGENICQKGSKTFANAIIWRFVAQRSRY